MRIRSLFTCYISGSTTALYTSSCWLLGPNTRSNWYDLVRLVLGFSFTTIFLWEGMLTIEKAFTLFSAWLRGLQRTNTCMFCPLRKWHRKRDYIKPNQPLSSEAFSFPFLYIMVGVLLDLILSHIPEFNPKLNHYTEADIIKWTCWNSSTSPRHARQQGRG